MDNSTRVKAMKRLYYYKKQALKCGDTSRANCIENEIEQLRVFKKHDPKYRARIKKRERISLQKNYKRELKSGYFNKRNKRYFKEHHDRVLKACHKWYVNTKNNPAKYKKYLHNRRVQRLKRIKKAKVINNE